MKAMYSETVGLLGGFGGYATLDFYRRFLEIFSSDCERNYPHLVIDNDFTMPSRTRALLTDEGYDEIVEQICRSMDRLLNSYKADHIILVCGTAHYFLDDVYKKIPEAKEKVLDIINITGAELTSRNIENVFVLATEGTLKRQLYPRRLSKFGIKCKYPDESFYREIRFYIEAVKKNQYDDDLEERFLAFLNQFQERNIVLGCTEFPVLVHHLSQLQTENQKHWDRYEFFDPLEFAIEKLKRMIA